MYLNLQGSICTFWSSYFAFLGANKAKFSDSKGLVACCYGQSYYCMNCSAEPRFGGIHFQDISSLSFVKKTPL